MSDLKGIYALWYREFKVFQREKSRVVASIVNPVLWLVIIGGGLGSVVSFGGVDYLSFLYPGILVQSALFSAVFFGVYIVWDKKIDFLKEVLVSPMSRTYIFVGKILGGSTDTLLQSAILLFIGYAFTATGVMAGARSPRSRSPFPVLFCSQRRSGSSVSALSSAHRWRALKGSS
jgi:ABC-2 type transport system permease protein